MDYSQPGFWIAIGVGGVLVASLSAFQQFMSKTPDQEIRYRAIVRDFCFGAFLTAILYMFLPESILSWVSAGQSALSNTVTKISSKVPTDSLGDIELQVGPARF